MTHASLVAVIAIAGLAAPRSRASSAPAETDPPAVGYRMNLAHTGAVTFAEPFLPPLRQRWSVNLGGPVSYPVIAEGMVFVTVANTVGTGTQLYALDRGTGAVLWRKLLPGLYRWSNAAYDSQSLFVLSDNGLLQGFNAKTGAALWSRGLGASGGGAAPTAANGLVFASTRSLYAVDERTGAIRWTAASMSDGTTDVVAPTVVGPAVFTATFCEVDRLAWRSGTLAWSDLQCDDGYGYAASFYGGRLYARQVGIGNLGSVLDPGTGKTLGRFRSVVAPAFLGDFAYTEWDRLRAVSITTGRIVWSFYGDGYISTAPVIVNRILYVGTRTGKLYALDGYSGRLLATMNVDASFAVNGEEGEDDNQPLNGLGAGEGILVAPAGPLLIAFQGR